MDLFQSLSVHKSDINGLSFGNTALATCSSDKTVRLWSLNNFNELPFSPICDHNYAVHCVCFSPSGNHFATCSTDGKCSLWDSNSGLKVYSFQHNSKCVLRACVFAQNVQHLSTGGDDGTICIWSLETHSLIRTLDAHEDAVTVLTYSPDSAFLISGTPNGDMKVWDGLYGHGKPLYHDLEAHDLGVTCAQFSPTYGSAGAVTSPAQQLFLLASGGFDHFVKIWDVYSYVGSSVLQVQLRTKLIGHSDAVYCLNFSCDGQLLASGSGDHAIRLWNTLRCELLFILKEAHSRYISSIAFSRDTRLLASGSNDKMVKIWKITKNFNSDVAPSTIPSPTSLTTSSLSAWKPPNQWSVPEVAKFITDIGMGQYTSNFTSNAIDGSELHNLTQESLKNDLGIEPLGHRSKILKAILQAHEHPTFLNRTNSEGSIPHEYLCPITKEIMTDPVIAADGYSYERSSIAAWIKSGKNNSPMTNAPLADHQLTPNRSLRILIMKHQLQ